MPTDTASTSSSFDLGRFAEWNRSFARVLTLMESDSGRAAKATIDALCTLTPNSIGAIWVYQPASVPLEVYPELGERSDELLRQVYKLGMYAVDPVFSAFSTPRMHDSAIVSFVELTVVEYLKKTGFSRPPFPWAAR